ncbi:MAG: hypothetical protein IIB66_11555, partial [Proteobacteria bacterium]|nr:hypothetical protein [Pseudomonadota bacterium]
MVLRTFVLLTGSLLLGGGQIAFAADAKGGDPKQPAITVAEADADFSLQGEYSGEIEDDGEKVKLGVQVIALGGGKFRAV